ncbi:nicotinate-nucleotide adenylyltransferase [Conexibacter arvalis]|uniref:Probable nicotinate-nucleotide adenylyltransferase n=1 Tax=Conexibacter arvalis TaxID=912552 RepID=A0A840IG36_9ACTN|nr:nicotinate-nucleotide adenylyltransferase [Conexibacter arvalis]MBB4663822.1 nicotinate-nucleotide adenylyltransferase [Conexibacter arvalis]
MRVGILGGTFNPPHLAHLVCAQEAHSQLGLDRVLLMPAGEPPHKTVAPGDPSPEQRFELCRLAVAGDERFEVSRIELERPGRSYTADTLRLLHERAPEDELVFIVGGDMAASFPSWREPEAVLSLATLAVAERRGSKRDAIERALEPLAGSERVTYFDMPRIDLSSSELRARVAQGRPIRYLVPDAVAEAIAAEGLYHGVRGEVTT